MKRELERECSESVVIAYVRDHVIAHLSVRRHITNKSSMTAMSLLDENDKYRSPSVVISFADIFDNDKDRLNSSRDVDRLAMMELPPTESAWTAEDNVTKLPGSEAAHSSSWFASATLGVALSSVIIAAVVGNCLVIAGVLRFRRLRTVANSFLVSLAVADLLVALLVMPFSAVQLVVGRWPFGRLTCDLFNANDVLFSTASLLHLCCVAVDRYVAVTDPFGYDRKMSRWRVGAMLASAWMASGLLSHVPIHMGWYSIDVSLPLPLQLPLAGGSSSSTSADSDVSVSAVTDDSRHCGKYDDHNDDRKWISVYTDGATFATDVDSSHAAAADISDECSFEVNRIYGIVSSGISFWIPATVMLFAYVKIFREAQRQERHIRALRCSIPTSVGMATPSSIDSRRSTLMRGSVAADSVSVTEAGCRLTQRFSDFGGPGSLLPVGYGRRLSRRLQTDNKAARTLGIIMGAFVVCWFPFFTWYVASTLCGADDGSSSEPGLCAVSTRPELIATLFWVGYANSALNPFIYAAFNRDFRQAFHSLLSSVVCCASCRCRLRTAAADAKCRERSSAHTVATSDGAPTTF
jgi:hypothetical protein